jgi:ABC-type sugar transport system permease subunit
VLWKQTPEFSDTFVTYAYHAGHAVNMVSVDNFDHFLSCLSEPSQKDSYFIEVLFNSIFIAIIYVVLQLSCILSGLL